MRQAVTMMARAGRTQRGLQTAAVQRFEAKAVDTTKAYTNSSITADEMRVNLPEEVHREIHDYIKKIAPQTPDVDKAVIDKSEMPFSEAFFRQIESERILHGPGIALLPKIEGLETIHDMRLSVYAITSLIGEPLVQNTEGHKGVLVYDRDSSRKMADGQRYHQSREGGGLHTDNVNDPNVWESMLLTCLQPAQVGGESIFVSVAAVHNYMCEHMPDAIEVLQNDFFYEFRGFGDGFYKAPLLYYNGLGEPCFRYLRSYMESAHERLGQPLTMDQIRALDLVDCIGAQSDFQVRAKFGRGETLWCNDVQTLHGRTSFIDSGESLQSYNLSTPVNRLYQRTWIKTEHPEFAGLNMSRFDILEQTA